MHITSLDSVAKSKSDMEGAEGLYKQIPVGTAQGVPNFSFRVFTLLPQGHTPYHEHAFEHVNYIIEGEGVLVDAVGREYPLKKGDFALILPSEKHQYRNKSMEKPFVIICAVPREYE